MKTSKRTGVGVFVIGVALFAIGLGTESIAFWIIGLVLVAFALLSACKSKTR